MIIGYTNKSFKFGVFNPEGYRSTDDYYGKFDAFLSYWINNDEADLFILPKVGDSGAGSPFWLCSRWASVWGRWDPH